MTFQDLVMRFIREMAIERLVNRNGFSREESERRIASQMSSEERIKHATRVIHNSGTKEELEREVHHHWNLATNSEEENL